MFQILFGWSKASTCKKAIKRTRYRLMLLKNKRQAIATQLRKDLADLILSGHHHSAFNRVEKLIEDENMAEAYELLDHFCEFILKKLSYIRKHKECPDDINEAVSSLIYASARLGDLHELCVIRKLFGERYGQKFATTAVDLLPGNLVNKQLRENLSRNYVPDDLKYSIVDDIARDNCLREQILAIEYYPNWQEVQEKENKPSDTVSRSKVHHWENEKISKEITCVDSSIFEPSDSSYLPKSSFADSSAIVSTIQQYPPYILTSPLQNREDKLVKVDSPKQLSSTDSCLQNKEGTLVLASSPEIVDYIDDIEEYQFSSPKNGATTQMLFKFRSSSNESYRDKDEMSSIKISRRNKGLTSKRSRRRSSNLENLSNIDIGYMIYYQKPCKTPSPKKKHQKSSLEGIPSSRKKQMLHSFSEKETTLNSCQNEDSIRSGCSLEQPCYFCLYDDEKEAHIEQSAVIDECCLCRPFCDDELNKGMELVTNGSLTRKATEASYSRAMTMPQERNRNVKDKMLRTYSCLSPYPNHVHPKLPDYDDIAAKFTAIKRENLGKKSLERTKDGNR